MPLARTPSGTAPGTPAWDSSWDPHLRQHLQQKHHSHRAAHCSLLSHRPLDFLTLMSVGATFASLLYSEVMRAPCLERRACPFHFFKCVNPSSAHRKERTKAGLLSPHSLPPSSQGLAPLLSCRTTDPTEPQNLEGGPSEAEVPGSHLAGRLSAALWGRQRW